ncbi:hypothetical protein [Nonomuraea typhae]|uniref:Uncharacterized protein n=1 Tax=Nonomuraea typhae TaxID=2603600 RepID=A0ABW7YJ79_9ACTN
MTTIAVDFDGVIHSYTQGWADGTVYDQPMPGAVNGLNALMMDYAVYIHTARDIEQVSTWLTTLGFRCRTIFEGDFWNTRDILLVTNRKLPASAYVDDRGIRFHSWAQVLIDLPNMV